MAGSSKSKYSELARKSITLDERLGFLMSYDHAMVSPKLSACARSCADLVHNKGIFLRERFQRAAFGTAALSGDWELSVTYRCIREVQAGKVGGSD